MGRETASINVNPDDDRPWQTIFALLKKWSEPEVGGRAGLSEESRKQMEAFARGELREEEIRRLCQEIVQSPEALDFLAAMLKKGETDGSAEVTP